MRTTVLLAALAGCATPNSPTQDAPASPPVVDAPRVVRTDAPPDACTASTYDCASSCQCVYPLGPWSAPFITNGAVCGAAATAGWAPDVSICGDTAISVVCGPPMCSATAFECPC